ncbi:MAG: bifunctional riboflavin kinase/FAD synthetase [Hyphomicrobiales bacterium]|nr:bifunctional riboflavin kinase/FAD synthetase [Hyphomicrobiales bacterium]MCP5000825.1 bifunctional riboflavin kinase/FAD synthetase [Hyphomicrobiales bacterium]
MRITALQDIPPELHDCVVAIGNFDGVHRGHQAVLDVALEQASSAGVPAVVLTFEPHPRTVFKPDQPVFRLTPAPLKAELAGLMGFAAVVELPFTKDFAQQSAETFVENVLVDALGISRVVTGFNFHFGRARQGSPEFLNQAGERLGFAVTVVEPFEDESAELVSSSRIRACIRDGDVAQAAALLGYHYTVQAEVLQGKKLGRTLGFPTANMALPGEADLRTGIYAVRFLRHDGKIHDGVASFGNRPTVDRDGAPLLETFIFDFDREIYGEICSVVFFSHLREEMKFNGLDLLVEQMKRDTAEAKAVLATIRPLGALDQALAFS